MTSLSSPFGAQVLFPLLWLSVMSSRGGMEGFVVKQPSLSSSLSRICLSVCLFFTFQELLEEMKTLLWAWNYLRKKWFGVICADLKKTATQH